MSSLIRARTRRLVDQARAQLQTASCELTTTQSTNCPPLPPELIAEIFDCLCGNEEALAACSLVCKSWTRLAHCRLFKDVTVDFHAGLERLRRALKEGSAAMIFIQRLSILSVYGSTTAVIYNEIIPQFTGLEMIRSLSLSNFAWRILKPEVKSAFFAHFSNIVRLQLRALGVLAFSDLETIIRAFPRLETLVLTHHIPLFDDGPSPSAISLPHNLRELELQVTDTNAFFKWLLSFPTIPALRTVYLHGTLPDAINSFLRALGPSLEVFRFDAYGQGPPNLQYNTNLRCIHVMFYSSTSPRWISQILTQIVSERMHDLVFELDVDGVDPGDPVEWREVDEILAQPQFIGLTIVTVTFCPQYKHSKLPKLSDWGMTHMPLCRARGILNICCGKWKEISL